MLAFKQDNTWIEFTNQRLPMVGQPSNRLYHVPAGWTNEEKQEKFGLRVVYENPVPTGKRVVSYSLVEANGGPLKNDIYEDVTVLTSAINEERERRIANGVEVTVEGVGSFYVDTDAIALRNIQGLASAATLRLMQGDTTTAVTFRDGSNTDRSLVPGQVVSLAMQVAGHINLLFQKSWAIKALDPIPHNFADDEFWD